MMDRIVTFGTYENLVGILSEETKNDSTSNNPAVIMLNAGMIHRVGPNRIYLKLARRLSEQGFDVLRFDFSGIGDSDHRQDNLPFTKSAPKEVISAMDYLGKARGATTFILIGHCSGVAVSIQAALDDPRAVGIVLVNAPAPNSQEGRQLESHAYYWRKAIFSPQSWIRLIMGKSNYARILKSVWSRVGGSTPRNPQVDPEEKEFVDFIAKAFKSIQKRGIKLLLITSGAEVGLEYYWRCVGSEMKELCENRLLDIRSVPEGDHTFTPLPSQEKYFYLVQDWIKVFESVS